MTTRRKEDEEEEVLTSYMCDTLFCSRTEGRQSRERRKSHRKKDEGLRDTQAEDRQPAHQLAKDTHTHTEGWFHRHTG